MTRQQQTPPHKGQNTRPAPSPMTEVETLREAFEERNREFAALEASGIPGHVARLPDYLGQGPGKVLHDMLTRQLEARRARSPGSALTDIDAATYDALSLAARSEHGPLSAVETWQLCYRLAYLVGYGDTTAKAATAAVRAVNRQRASTAGKARWKAMNPIREYATSLLPAACYGADGKRLKKWPAAEPGAAYALRDDLKHCYPEGDLPTEETVAKWLTDWHRGQGFATWRAMPSTWTPGEPWPPKGAS